jgi:hypothetical protein
MTAKKKSAALPEAPRIPLLFDLKLRRPGCVLLAAAYGANSHAVQRFNSEQWLTSPTPNMKIYSVTMDELKQIAAKVNAQPKPKR